MMPRVGANPPMSPKNLAPALSAAFLGAISASMKSRSSSGSVPSTASSIPLRMKGSSTDLAISSSASKPSRRARSAKETSVVTVSSAECFVPMRAVLRAVKAPVASFRRPQAMATPNVPRNTRTMAGGRRMAAGLPPSMTMEPKTAAKARPIPTRVPGSMSALVPVGDVDEPQGNGRRGGPQRRGVGGARRQLVLELGAAGEDAGPEVADALDDLGEALGHDVLRGVDERQDRVGVGVDALHQVAVDGELLAVQSGEDDHRSVLGELSRGAGPWRPDGPSDRPAGSRPEGRQRLTLEVDEVLEQFVRSRDDAGVRLEAALGDDQVGELLGKVDVAHLERAARQRAPTAAAGLADLGQAGVDAGPVERAAGLLQTGGVGESGQGDLPDGAGPAVGEDTRDDAVLPDTERLQRPEGRPVLGEGSHAGLSGELAQRLGVAGGAEVDGDRVRAPRPGGGGRGER